MQTEQNIERTLLSGNNGYEEDTFLIDMLIPVRHHGRCGWCSDKQTALSPARQLRSLQLPYELLHTQQSYIDLGMWSIVSRLRRPDTEAQQSARFGG
jgi:hypothetical protein